MEVRSLVISFVPSSVCRESVSRDANEALQAAFGRTPCLVFLTGLRQCNQILRGLGEPPLTVPPVTPAQFGDRMDKNANWRQWKPLSKSVMHPTWCGGWHSWGLTGPAQSGALFWVNYSFRCLKKHTWVRYFCNIHHICLHVDVFNYHSYYLLLFS